MTQIDREIKAYNARVRRFTKVIGEADLTNAVNGTAQTIDIGTLPIGAFVLHSAFKLTTQFTGGGLASVGMIIGDSGDDDRIITTADVFGGATGNYVGGTKGVYAGPYAAATVLQAKFTPDGGHNLNQATAGSVTVDIVYCVPSDDTIG